MKRIAYILLIYCVLLLSSFSLHARGITQEEIINNLQEATRNLENAIQSICPSDSQLKNGQCVCKEGYIFNGEACITYTQACQSKYGLHTYGDKNYCYCTEGYVWNKERTKCITYTEDCRLIYGEHVVGRKGDAKNNSYCDCEKGYVWNNQKTACINIDQYCQDKLGPNAYGDTNLQCHCKDGYVANSENTKCITYTESCYFTYGEHVIGHKGDKENIAFCD